ncbi:uncharacterized protein BKA55DRAFT_696320 [Fusarium redolens]|uniref:Uncharacterized protein n=1 Tax=Fusarium redolens TaxID=48865 RepID=A0A9P9JN96_FUSRE|nr:uncharacterized protein BKA55DRAFT_696320 [Fusarium redolens]KAH7231402.1 hypothetical protein BKA55DRAFT_696320 [Fusarium redolens]
MMRHILYLVTLLQRDATNYDWNPDEGCEGDGDEPSDCDDEVEDEEEDDHGTDEDYINEYDRVETEIHSNGNDEYHDMNDGEDDLPVDPTFSHTYLTTTSVRPH